MKKHLVLLVVMMLSMGVQAGEVLYAEVDGANMTLKCGDSAPDGTFKYTGSDEWSRSLSSTITTVTVDASCTSYTGTSLASLFHGFGKLESIIGLSNLNTANVTSMKAMFLGCNALTSLVFSGWDTANVTNMSSMFQDCYALVTLDLSTFNTKNVTDMNGMFIYCQALTSLDLSGWDTSNVTKVNAMFFGCRSLTSLDLSSFNTSKVRYMTAMFWGCRTLSTIYGKNWDTSLVTESGEMFMMCDKLVGGAGTVYSRINADNRNYARIDGGPEAPGYFTDKDATGVKALTTSKMMTEHTPVYNLQGQRVESVPRKGVYIQNGKKVVIK